MDYTQCDSSTSDQIKTLWHYRIIFNTIEIFHNPLQIKSTAVSTINRTCDTLLCRIIVQHYSKAYSNPLQIKQTAVSTMNWTCDTLLCRIIVQHYSKTYSNPLQIESTAFSTINRACDTSLYRIIIQHYSKASSKLNQQPLVSSINSSLYHKLDLGHFTVQDHCQNYSKAYSKPLQTESIAFSTMNWTCDTLL